MAERNAEWSNEEEPVQRVCAIDLWDENMDIVRKNGTYDERVFADSILEHIRDSNQSKPFFIYYAMPTPHFPLTRYCTFVSLVIIGDLQTGDKMYFCRNILSLYGVSAPYPGV